jgi:hypothetical protein
MKLLHAYICTSCNLTVHTKTLVLIFYTLFWNLHLLVFITYLYHVYSLYYYIYCTKWRICWQATHTLLYSMSNKFLLIILHRTQNACNKTTCKLTIICITTKLSDKRNGKLKIFTKDVKENILSQKWRRHSGLQVNETLSNYMYFRLGYPMYDTSAHLACYAQTS